MGRSLFCDLCRKEVAIEDALKQVLIGDVFVAEVCLNCASQLEQGIKKSIVDNEAAIVAAQRAAQAPPPQPTSPKSQAEKPVEQAKPGLKAAPAAKGQPAGVK